MRAVIPFRVHLVLDASAAVALLVVPFLFGFAGTARVLAGDRHRSGVHACPRRIGTHQKAAPFDFHVGVLKRVSCGSVDRGDPNPTACTAAALGFPRAARCFAPLTMATSAPYDLREKIVSVSPLNPQGACARPRRNAATALCCGDA
jgi:hypothetical protein